MSETDVETAAEHEDGGPECDLCGKTDCPDADLPEFSEPVACPYVPIYEALRYDRCDYGCARDITKASIRRDIVPTVERMTTTGPGAAMSTHSEAQWNAAISAALQADDIEAVPQLLVLMALDGYGHEAESLRRAMVALTTTTTADPERAALAEGSDT